MATQTIQQVKVIGKACGGSQMVPLQNLAQMSLANAFRTIGQWFLTVAIGGRNFNGSVHSNGVQASGTVTLSSFAAADTVTVNGTVLTSNASPSGQGQFLSTGGDTVVAAALAACINANTALKTVVVATSALAVVTVKCLEQGLIGNLCTLAISAHGSVSGANMTGGTDGTVVNLSKGI